MFTDIFLQQNWNHTLESILSKNHIDIENALHKENRNLEDFKALISPEAQQYLEPMALLSQRLTQKRFGKTIQMYLPIYLSNECQNICTYCAFSLDNKIPRRTLSDSEILREAHYIKSLGYEHILIVTGESNKTVGVAYLENAIRLLKPLFSNIQMEVQPLEIEDYLQLKNAGLHTVLVYQETYRAETYKQYHPKGKKSNFEFRLETPDRLGLAGIHKIGLGSLIGLEDWRTDCFFTAMHLQYLKRTYWQSKYSISFPRLRPIEKLENHTQPNFNQFMSDKELVQLICAYRLFDENVEISISTREKEIFRDNIIPLGITSMSAGSKTNPGGYRVAPQSLEQFEISDERSGNDIAKIIRSKGYEPVWKDWENIYSS
ncbi:MAG: 2-iminoacetate synthase ThiH [Pseudopedobacter saltans]|uniref:2-iminoacetate synthase ThiH n=1 Tax=Pseudopedobacter saltans TaxID=151895 RepID=A0A2W5EL51_9SPHI|nr:MAG: 2-iminoacetate synthase ThiH [Pseudopedobacter saltans]